MKRLRIFLLIFFLVGPAFAQTNSARMLSGVNAQTGTTYTFVAQDATRLVTFANAGSVAVTLPSGLTPGFNLGTLFSAQNLGPGTVTITCSACLIFAASPTGSATLTLVQGQGADIYSAGLNYSALLGGGGTAAQVGALADPGSNGIVKRTAPNVAGVATGADVDALFSGAGKCYLFKGTTPGTNDGCDTPPGTVSASGPPAAHQPTVFTSATDIKGVSAGAADSVYMGNDAGTGADPAFKSGPGSCSGSTDAATYNSSTHAWGCHTITPGTGTLTSVGATGTPNQITVTPSGANPITGAGGFTFSIPNPFVAPGSIQATTSLQAGASTILSCGSASGILCGPEGATTGTPTAGESYLRFDTGHVFKASLNGGAEFTSLASLAALESSIEGLWASGSCSGYLHSGGTCSTPSGYSLPAQYALLHMQGAGLGDGLNAITAGTYPLFLYSNDSAVTWTVTAISCYTSNSGSSTMDVKNNAGTSLLTAPVTCTNVKATRGAPGTQSATVTLAPNDGLTFTFVSDGASLSWTPFVLATQ